MVLHAKFVGVGMNPIKKTYTVGFDATGPYSNVLAFAGKLGQLRPALFIDTLGLDQDDAAVKLLEDAGCRVVVPEQTCCGQPAFNSGDRPNAKAIARQTIAAFADCDYVVAPSGSCAGTLAKHYPELFEDEPHFALDVAAFAAKCRELISFLVDDLGVTSVAARYDGVATYHDSCSGLRELGVQ